MHKLDSVTIRLHAGMKVAPAQAGYEYFSAMFANFIF